MGIHLDLYNLTRRLQWIVKFSIVMVTCRKNAQVFIISIGVTSHGKDIVLSLFTFFLPTFLSPFLFITCICVFAKLSRLLHKLLQR